MKGLSFGLIRQIRRFNRDDKECTIALVRELQSLSIDQREEAHRFLDKIEQNMTIRCAAIGTINVASTVYGFVEMNGFLASYGLMSTSGILIYYMIKCMNYAGVQRCFEQVKKD